MKKRNVQNQHLLNLAHQPVKRGTDIPECKQACSAMYYEPSENSEEGIRFTVEEEATAAVAEKQTQPMTEDDEH